MDKALKELEQTLLKFVMEHGTPFTTITYSADIGLKIHEDEKARKEWQEAFPFHDEVVTDEQGKVIAIRTVLNAEVGGEVISYGLGDILQSKLNKDWVEIIISKTTDGYYKTRYIEGVFDGMVSVFMTNARAIERECVVIGNILERNK